MDAEPVPHGEQGALMASAQVTEATPIFDGKYYGATQVMDEARHVECSAVIWIQN